MPRTLMITSPMLSGPDVLDVQERLAAGGFDPGRLDGVFGVATLTAVRTFQAAHGLDVDGIVGPATRAALRGKAPASSSTATHSRNGGKEPPGVLALAEAIRHLGTTESRGANRTPFGEWYGMNGVPWCDIFVSYCFSVGAGYIICDGFSGAGVTQGKGCAYVPTTEAWLRATGMWRGRSEPAAGDIAIFNWDGREPDHIGIVESSLGGGKFTTVEGNSGDRVQRCQRYVSQVDGFGRVPALRI